MTESEVIYCKFFESGFEFKILRKQEGFSVQETNKGGQTSGTSIGGRVGHTANDTGYELEYNAGEDDIDTICSI